MLQPSKVLTSREEWKSKAVERATDLREFRKTEKRHLKKNRRAETSTSSVGTGY